VAFVLPAHDSADAWQCLIDTGAETPVLALVDPATPLTLLPYSALVLAATRTRTPSAVPENT
jgi:hypothetical protein